MSSSSTIKDVMDITESNTCVSKNWWLTNGRYVTLGIIAFFVILLFLYVYKMLKSFSRQLHHLTDIISDQQERLNLHSKLLFHPNIVEENHSDPTPKLSLKDISLSSCGDKIDQLFHLSHEATTAPEEIIPVNDKEIPVNIEEEIADEIKELEASAHNTTLDDAGKEESGHKTTSDDVVDE